MGVADSTCKSLTTLGLFLASICGALGQTTTPAPIAYVLSDGPPLLVSNCTGASVTAAGVLQGTRRHAAISVRYDNTVTVNVSWAVSYHLPPPHVVLFMLLITPVTMI